MPKMGSLGWENLVLITNGTLMFKITKHDDSFTKGSFDCHLTVTVCRYVT